ncbi:acyl-CoA synthetase [Pseudoalteromonas sp. KG3]|uniref:Acyl-CoA synthetase n=1 Tax=Pseudoalteromonas prydzensis TaxID=182141 RepID=A0ABR9FL32_9GAMM|nr:MULTISPECIES: acyl-CoA synthetase [Pseudoalteromonas]MBE0457542.1 acyl-CoA synthetase [Pseudoalteromonas prydzensis]WKD26121.1 acyl-CoA synthetase [Pseudoalteromonas sp. KG3]
MTNFVYKPTCDVLEQSPEQVLLRLTIPENLYYFQGHFPQAAILPGVAQLDWVMHYLTQYLNVDCQKVVSVDALKFQIIVQPNYQVNLLLKKIKDTKYSFSYSSEHGQHASGKVVLTDE